MKITLFYLSLITTVLILSISCSKSENDILEKIGGVWKLSNENTLMTIQLTSNEKTIRMGNLEIPVKVKSVDADNSIVNLIMTDKDGIEQIWTLKQVWLEDEKSFTLLWTAHDGSQFNLEFVRNL